MRKAVNTYPPEIPLEEAVNLLTKFNPITQIPDHLFRLIYSILQRDRRSIKEACTLIEEKLGKEGLGKIMKLVRKKLNDCMEEAKKQEIKASEKE